MQQLDRALLWMTRIGVFCIPFIPLIISGSMFFPFITGKNFAFRILVEILLAMWLLLALRRAEWRPKRSALLYAIGAFLLIVLTANLLGANPFKSFWSNFERMEGYLTLLHLGAYFLIASSVLANERFWMRFFETSVGVSAFLGIYGILQLSGKIVINQGGVRLDGTFGNAAYFAGYLLFHVFLTLLLLYRHRASTIARYLLCGAIVLQVFTLFFTATRGAGVGLVAGLFLSALLISLFEREHPKLRYTAIATIVALISLLTVLGMAKDTPFVKGNETLTRFASISLKDASPRFMVWRMAFEGFKENPVLGWGQENFNLAFNKYYDPNMWSQEQWFDRTHNILLDWLIAAGILGLLSYLSLYALILWYVWKGGLAGAPALSVTEKSVLTGLLAAYFVHNLFVFDNIASYLLFFSLLAYIHWRQAHTFAVLERLPQLREKQTLYVTAASIVVVLIASSYFLNIRGIIVARALIGGLKQHEKGPSENLAFYKQAASFNSLGSQEVAEQLLQVSVPVIRSQNVPAEVRNEFLALSEATMGHELLRAPDDARLHMFMGGFYGRLGNNPKAQTHLEQALSLSPAKQTIAMELAGVYLNSGKSAEALDLLRKAYERTPAFVNARIAYATAAIYTNKADLAAELLNGLSDDEVLMDERVLKAYFDVKAYSKVLDIWKRRVAKEPDNGKFRVSLAASYMLAGQRQKAIDELEEARKLMPDSREEIDFYISEIRAGRNP